MKLKFIKTSIAVAIVTLFVGVAPMHISPTWAHEEEPGASETSPSPSPATPGVCEAKTHKGKTFQGRYVTSGFGMRNPTDPPGASTYHKGIDLRIGDSPNVTAIRGGRVTVQEGGGYGKYVTVTETNFEMRYAHAGSVSVETGQNIAAGTVLGNWARCTPQPNCQVHLHLEYRVRNASGEWVRVDPWAAELRIQAGEDPNSPEFAAAAIADTVNGCNIDEASLRGGGGGNTGVPPSEGSASCDPNIQQQINERVQAVSAFRQNAMQQIITPPPAPSAIANTPCSSNAMQNASNLFSSMPQQFMQGTSGLTGQTSGTINQFFEASVTSLNEASRTINSMLDIQSRISSSIGDVISNMLGGAGFSQDLCGLMTNVVTEFLQCQMPFDIPSFPSLGDLITGSLNDLIGNLGGQCGGNAMRSMLYNNTLEMPNLGQPPGSGTIRPALGQ